MRSILSGLRVVLALSLLLAMEPLLAGDSEELVPKVGEDAPAFSLRAYNEEAALRTARSPLVSLNHFVGLVPESPRKAVLVSFCSITNEKCRRDVPVFQRLYKRYKDDGLVVLMISVDNKEVQALYDSIEKEKVTFPVLRDRFQVVYKRYGVTKLPTVFLMDKDGKVASVGEGYQEDVESYLDSEIKRLLKE